MISYRIYKLWDNGINCFVTEDIAMQSSLKTDRIYSTMYAQIKSKSSLHLSVEKYLVLHHEWTKKRTLLFHPIKM